MPPVRGCCSPFSLALGRSASGLEVGAHGEELVSERLEDRVRVLNDYGYDFILLRYHQEMEPPPSHANRPITIDAKLSAVEEVLEPSRH